MARKSKLTQALIDEAADIIRSGNYASVACNALGVSETSWYNWLKDAEAEKPQPLKLAFLEAIKSAEAEAEKKNLKVVLDAGKKHWQAAAWYLERKHPERWGRFQRIEHDFKGGVLTVPAQQTADEWEKFVRGGVGSGNGAQTH